MRPTERRTRRGLGRAGATTIGATVLAACGAPDGTGGGGAKTRKPVTLQYWSRFAAPIEGVEERYLPVFQEQHAPYRVERTLASTDYGKLVEKVTTAFASGTPPDVFTMGSPDIVTYAHPGSALQLDAYAGVRKHAGDFFGPTLSVGRYQDKLYGLTYYIDTRIMMYRKDLLAEAGLPTDRKSLPKTWDQFREVAKRLVRWEGTELKRLGWDIATMGDATQFLVMLGAAEQEGHRGTTGERVEFDGPEGQRALQTLVDFVHRDRIDAVQRPSFPSGVDPLGTAAGGDPVGQRGADLLDEAGRDGPGGAGGAGPDPRVRREADRGVVPGRDVADGGQERPRTWTRSLELAVFLTNPEVGLGGGRVAVRAAAGQVLRAVGVRAAGAGAPLLRARCSTGGWCRQHPRYAEIRAKLIEVTKDAMAQQKAVRDALAEAAAYATGLLAGA